MNYYAGLESITDTLETLALKELDGIPFNESEVDFLRRVLTSEWQPSNSRDDAIAADGWYIQLFFGDTLAASQDAYDDDFIVADVHTQPTEEFGTIVGRVLHVGVGQVNLGVYLVEQTPSGDSSLAYVGPVMSYYEHITENFDRLTDERWFEIVDAGEVPLRPDWVNIFLMDGTGSRHSQGRELEGEVFMGIEDPSVSRPVSFRLYHNFPNPFNPITTIHYDLPNKSTVTITIHDILGRHVKTLVNKTQNAGYKSVNWDATNNKGKPVSVGVYIYKIQAGEFVQTKKMVLLK